MNSTRLQDIKEESARVVVQYSNGYMDAIYRGAANDGDILNQKKRLHYLYSIIRECFLTGTDVYIGDTVLADNIVETIYTKIQHYSGIYSDVDLSEYTDVTEDDGNEGSKPCTPVVTDDHYRSATVNVTSGTNIITFIKNGVPTPFESNDYTVVMWVTLTDGSIQRNLVPTSRTASGFVVSDVLGAGVLEYQATLNT